MSTNEKQPLPARKDEEVVEGLGVSANPDPHGTGIRPDAHKQGACWCGEHHGGLPPTNLHDIANLAREGDMEAFGALVDELGMVEACERVAFKGMLSSAMPVEERGGIWDTKVFGGRVEGMFAPGGVPYYSRFVFPRFQWERLGSPAWIEIYVRAHEPRPEDTP